MTKLPLYISILLSLCLLACENPIKRTVKDIKYSSYEMIGVEKRDLLKRHIGQTREDQEEAAETFEDALDKLRKLYDMKPSELERQYNSVKSSYDDSENRAKDVRASREKMKTVASDLFKEWEKEIDEIQTPEMKSKSREKLKASRSQFAELDKSLVLAEKKMNPVLIRLKDHVLYLKHNLNAESLSSLKKEHDRIGNDIEVLVKDMNRAIAQADEFIKTLP